MLLVPSCDSGEYCGSWASVFEASDSVLEYGGSAVDMLGNAEIVYVVGASWMRRRLLSYTHVKYSAVQHRLYRRQVVHMKNKEEGITQR